MEACVKLFNVGVDTEFVIKFDTLGDKLGEDYCVFVAVKAPKRRVNCQVEILFNLTLEYFNEVVPREGLA